jgi:hypothetical protein
LPRFHCCCCCRRRRYYEYNWRPPLDEDHSRRNPVRPNPVPVAPSPPPQPIVILTHWHPADEPIATTKITSEGERKRSQHHKTLRRVSVQISDIDTDTEVSVLLKYWEQTRHSSGSVAATEIQRLFNKEDKLLREEGAALRAHMFTCGMCLETYPEDYVARVPGCPHEFCRDCMYKYVDSKLTERILPTFCPGCAAIDARGRPGCKSIVSLLRTEAHENLAVITSDLVRTLGLNDDQYRIFQELELAPLLTFLECLKCVQSVP